MSKNFCIRNFRSLLLTATLAEFSEFAVHLSNNIIAGQFFGEEGISALHLTLPLISFLLFITNIVCIGTYICYSFEIGRFNKEAAHEYFGQGVALTVIIGIVMAGVSLLFRNELIQLLTNTHTDNDYVLDYFKFLPLVMLLQPITMLISQIVYIDGDKETATAAYSVQIFGNIFFSWFLCSKMGVAGVCLGTVISFLLTLAVLAVHFFREINTVKFKWHANFGAMLHIAKFSAVKSSSILCFSMLTAVVNSFILIYGKSELLPVFAAIMNVVEFAVIFDGVEAALAPMFGTLHAEHNYKTLRIMIKEAVKVAFIEGIIATILLICFAPQIVHLFGLHDSENTTLAISCIRIMSLSLCALSITKLFAGYYLHMEYIALSVVICVLSAFISPIIFITLFIGAVGELGLGIAMFVSPIFTILVIAIAIYLIYHEKFPYLLETERDDNIHIYDTELDSANVMAIVEKIDELLKENNIKGKSSTWVTLFSEEIGMMIIERNKGKKIYAQYIVDLNGDNINLIIRDSGKIFDITDTDSRISSLRSFVVSGIMEKQELKYYQITTGYNRNAFRFPKYSD